MQEEPSEEFTETHYDSNGNHVFVRTSNRIYPQIKMWTLVGPSETHSLKETQYNQILKQLGEVRNYYDKERSY